MFELLKFRKYFLKIPKSLELYREKRSGYELDFELDGESERERKYYSRKVLSLCKFELRKYQNWLDLVCDSSRLIPEAITGKTR